MLIVPLKNIKKTIDDFLAEETNEKLWKGTEFEGYFQLNTSQQGLIGQHIVQSIAECMNFRVRPRTESSIKRKSDCDLIIEGITSEIKLSLDTVNMHFRFEMHKEVERFVYVKVYPPSQEYEYDNKCFNTENGAKILILWINKNDIEKLITDGAFNVHVGGAISCSSKRSFDNLVNHPLARPLWDWNINKPISYVRKQRPIIKDIFEHFTGV